MNNKKRSYEIQEAMDEISIVLNQIAYNISIQRRFYK